MSLYSYIAYGSRSYSNPPQAASCFPKVIVNLSDVYKRQLIFYLDAKVMKHIGKTEEK